MPQAPDTKPLIFLLNLAKVEEEDRLNEEVQRSNPTADTRLF